MPARADDLVAVGRVIRPHGLRGEAAVEVLTDFPERFAAGRELLLRNAAGEVRSIRIASVRPHAGRYLLRFEGIETSGEVECLRDADLCASPGDEPERPEGFVFHHEAAGLRAFAADGRSLGTVRDLVDVAGRPLLVLATPRGEREVPFTRPFVVSVDLKGRRIVLDLPAGLLD